uniref:Secreted protein n=1 Tax=Heterorhabditis bacteriophora TaxID=37862 RepID=A0A1I7X9S9_HETBA
MLYAFCGLLVFPQQSSNREEAQFDAESESVIRMQNRSLGSELQSTMESVLRVHFVASHPGSHCTLQAPHRNK